MAAGWNHGKEGYHFYQLDEQLSTVYITGRYGETENCYRYDAFGSFRDHQEEFPNRILYAGQQYDHVMDQYYLRARYYNPSIGGFLQEDVYRRDGLNLYVYCKNNPIMYYDPSGFSDQREGLDIFPQMTYEERVEALYKRRDELFQQKKDTGKLHYSNSGLLPGEMDSVLGMMAKSGDDLSPHHMPSAHSINRNEGIDRPHGACSNVMTDTHKDTFTYGMNSNTRPYDVALYESLTYEDRIDFDHYDLLGVYAETRPKVDMDVVESRLQDEYDLAMEMKGVRESLTLEGEKDMGVLEEMEEDSCK